MMTSTPRAILLTAVVGITSLLSALQAVPTAPTIPTYPNTAAGLEQLMKDMIGLQRNGDGKTLRPYLEALVLPDAGQWFTSEFGDVHCAEGSPSANDCMGPRLAFNYQLLARAIPTSFALTLQDLIDEGLTNFEATNISEDCAAPLRIVPEQKLLAGLSTTPMVSSALPGPVQRREPVYALWIYSENKETTLPFFVYSNGAFRYLGMLSPASFDDLRNGKGAAETSPTPPAARYLTEDQLDVKNAVVDPDVVRRTVVLHVVADANGKPREVNYVRGPEAFKDAAIESAKKRRFPPPTFLQAFHATSISTCVNVVAPR